MSRKGITKKDKLRAWNLPEKFQWSQLRYKHPMEKGVYWFFLSRFIRERDVRMYGTCISCGKAITVETSDAGHFMPARDCGRDLLFDEINVNAECSRCNAWDDTHLLGYAEGLDRRYGEGTAMKLRQRYADYKNGGIQKDWTAKEYAEKIKQLPSFKA